MKGWRVIAVDPGKNLGWAKFDFVFDHLSERVELVACGLALRKSDDSYDLPVGWGHASELVVEVPRYYPHHGNVDPNDLLELAHWAGEVAHHYRAAGMRVRRVEPAEWKGQVKKPIHHGRILGALTPAEFVVLEPHRKKATKTHPTGFDHNLLDAVALGLWALGRVGRGGVPV